jgi:putative serine protease PepD
MYDEPMNPTPPPPPWNPAPEPEEPRLEWAEAEGPLPVCDYTGEGDEACEEPAKQKRWSSAAVVTAASLGSLAGGLLVAAAAAWAFGMMPGGRAAVSSVAQTATQGVAQKISIVPNAQNVDVATAVAKKVVPSVVSVTIQQAVTDFGGNQSFQKVGTGSGVIIRSDGYILTNNHVVEGAQKVVVTVGLEDKVATVVGVDPSTDLAVLKIEGSGYPAVEAGSSKDLQVGQFVMAVGSPFGLEKTVTSGIISALQRSEQAQGQTANDITTYTNLIQTDAAINPGNSGGALVDGQGKLVGINSLIQSPSGGVGAAQSAGIGFAIPVDFAIDIANQLIATGKAVHSYVGISTETVDENLAAQFGLPMKSGALVRFVSPGAPAEAAGIKRGDVVVKIGDTRITGVADVFAAIREQKAGDTVAFELVRSGQPITVSVTLGSDAANQ